MTTIKQPTLIEDLGTMLPTATSKEKKRYGIYLCQCGKEFRARVANVKNGTTKSCGCYKLQRTAETHTTHGLKKHPLYNTWQGMVKRTTNQNEKNFKHYGGRGISVCDEWINSPQVFFDWCYGNGYENGLQIDRINNDGNYEPSNCRFVTNAVNSRNKRRIMVTNTSGYRGVSFSKDRKKWEVQIVINRKRKHLGYFPTALAGAVAYDSYVLINNLEHTINGVVNRIVLQI